MATPDQTLATTTKAAKEPGPGLWLSLIMLSVGFVACGAGCYLAFQSAFELLSIDSFETPGAQTRDLDPGEYQIYVRSASVSLLNLDVDFDETLPSLSEITVTNADSGEPVVAQSFRSNEPLSRSANVYEGVAIFEVVSEGRYTVDVASIDSSRAVFGRSIESAFDRIVPWLIMAIVGLILFVVGTILLIVGMVRRKSHRDRQSAMPAMPAMPAAVPADGPTPATQAPPVHQPPAPQPTETETPWGP
ncbi:MAG: hypothetical protein R8J94_17210 [Acidimicrobiia bacterium]|nr:hypothetical protein [Acidimicrobiia bacterium]